MEVIKARELAADENARSQTSETPRLRPGNHVALRLTKAERQAESKFSPLFKARMLSSMLNQPASLPTLVVSLRGTWQQLTDAASNF